LFRFLFILTTLFMLVSPRTLHLPDNAGNMVQKALIILTAVAFVATRPANRTVVGLIVGIAVLTFVCALGNDYPGFEWRLYAGGLVSIVAPFVLLTAQPEERDRQLVLLVFAALPVAAVVLGACYQVVGIGSLFSSSEAGGSRLGGSLGGAPWLAGVCVTGSFAALELAERRHFGYAALLILNVVILLLTGARTPLAVTVFICGFAYLRSFRRFPVAKFFAPIWAASFAAIGLMLAKGDLFRHLASTSLTGRDVIWAPLRRHLAIHPWFGVGLGNQQLLVTKNVLMKANTIGAHNEYLRLAVELGYPGAITFFVLSLTLCFIVWNSTWVRRDPMFLVCVIAFYLFGFTDNTFAVPQIYFLLTCASFAGRGQSASPREKAPQFSRAGPSSALGATQTQNLIRPQ
jgi:O-antigen ligase